MTRSGQKPEHKRLAKAPSGIRGLDEITMGGLPRGRPTLVSGGPGCGKTLFAIEFLAHGALDYDEPGVFMAFEENADELAQNVASLGFDLDRLVAQRKLAIDYVRVERDEIEETGEYNLDGLFVRLGYAVEAIGAKRVVLDTIEALFAGLPNEAILRSELRRLFRWLKERGLTAIVTGERGENSLTRYGLEEYVADCVILLDHRVNDQVSTRRLRVVKYRGSVHGTNEYPFLIDETGITVLPITSLRLEHTASRRYISTGIPRLDEMLEGRGYYQGSSVLISGTAGTGKTSLAAHFVDAACARGQRSLYFAFEESESQIGRNMESIGLDLSRWVRRGLLRFHNARPSLYGLEMHLATMHKLINDFDPGVVVVDPVTNLTSAGSLAETHSMLTRLIDLLKGREITSVYTALVSEATEQELSAVGISSLMDTWLLLRDLEMNGERNRILYILKARGMAHSNQVREFRLTDHGVELLEPYLGSAGVLLGTAREAQEARDRVSAREHNQEVERMQRDLERQRQMTQAQIMALQADYDRRAEETSKLIAEALARETTIAEERQTMARLRQADMPKSKNGREKRTRKERK